MLNRIVIMGRLTRDPELRRTQNGTAVTSFSVAVDRDFKSRESGEKATDFIDVVAWRQTAEFVCQYFTKAAWPWSRADYRSATGKTRMATTAAARKWLPTTFISATASATASRRRLRAPRLRLSRRELYRSCERRLCRN